MKRRVHVELRASTQTNANAYRTAIENALSNRPRFSDGLPPRAANEFGIRSARFQARFENAADADAVFAAAASRGSRSPPCSQAPRPPGTTARTMRRIRSRA